MKEYNLYNNSLQPIKREAAGIVVDTKGCIKDIAEKEGYNIEIVNIEKKVEKTLLV